MNHAQKRPHLIRFSHEVPKGQFKLRDGVVEDVFAVRKLSLIAEPGGVNKGLFESTGDTEMTLLSVKELRENHSDSVKVIEQEALLECSCQKAGGSVEVAISLQAKIDELKAELIERDEKVAELECELQLIERRKEILEKAKEEKRSISAELLEMLCGISGDNAADRISKIMEGLPLIEVNDEEPAPKPTKKARSTPPAPVVGSTRKNRFSALWQ
jgi:hypothetical protein